MRAAEGGGALTGVLRKLGAAGAARVCVMVASSCGCCAGQEDAGPGWNNERGCWNNERGCGLSVVTDLCAWTQLVEVAALCTAQLDRIPAGFNCVLLVCNINSTEGKKPSAW